MFGQSQTDVLEKMDRPDQLISQIGISGRAFNSDMSEKHSLERKIHHAENDKTQSEDWVSK